MLTNVDRNSAATDWFSSAINTVASDFTPARIPDENP
jgi:hypothetical protein